MKKHNASVINNTKIPLSFITFAEYDSLLFNTKKHNLRDLYKNVWTDADIGSYGFLKDHTVRRRYIS
jgi:hypothetical protein